MLSEEAEILIGKATERLGRLLRETLRQQPAFQGHAGLTCHFQNGKLKKVEQVTAGSESLS